MAREEFTVFHIMQIVYGAKMDMEGGGASPVSRGYKKEQKIILVWGQQRGKVGGACKN